MGAIIRSLNADNWPRADINTVKLPVGWGKCDLKPFDEILFCNFFYLHRTENTVIKNIYDRGQAVLFMQGDQRRWPALSRIAKTFGTPIIEGKEVKPTTFNLKIYEAFDSSCPGRFGQRNFRRYYMTLNQQSLFCLTGIFFPLF